MQLHAIVKMQNAKKKNEALNSSFLKQGSKCPWPFYVISQLMEMQSSSKVKDGQYWHDAHVVSET